MASTSVRTYHRSSVAPATASALPGSSQLAPAGTWRYQGITSWQVRADWWPLISAFVVRRPYAQPTLITVAAETALLMENTNWRRGADLSWNLSAMSCPSHMSRFLTESLGLCIAIQSAPVYRWTPMHAIWDADRLPKNNPLYVSTGTRPDFVIQTPAGWHGVEARARGDKGPVRTGRPVAVQKKKLIGMHQWSAQVGVHPQVPAPPSWSMTWAWITDTATWVDHFDPGEPVEFTGRQEQLIWDRMSDAAEGLAEVDDPRVQRLAVLDRPAAVVSRPVQDGSLQAPTWLTVASWSERMTVAELEQRRADGDSDPNRRDAQAVPQGPAVVEQATLGAFMASVITRGAPSRDQLPGLLDAAVAAASRDTDNPPDARREYLPDDSHDDHD